MSDEKDELQISPHEVLLKVKGWLSLEELLSRSGYDTNHRDIFFDELVKQINERKIVVLRANSFDARFIAAENWDPDD